MSYSPIINAVAQYQLPFTVPFYRDILIAIVTRMIQT